MQVVQILLLLLIDYVALRLRERVVPRIKYSCIRLVGRRLMLNICVLWIKWVLSRNRLMRQIVDISVLNGSLVLLERVDVVLLSLYFFQRVRLESGSVALVVWNVLLCQKVL